MTHALRRALARAYGLGWEMRRRTYAAGWARPQRVAARVVSVGNITVGGTGKTTLTLHLAHRAQAAGISVAIVLRDYRPGPQRLGDEHLLARAVVGPERVFGGRSKRAGALRAVESGAELVLVDDGFSHWALARDLDVVLLDARDPLGGGAVLPAGRLREPHRALQRAGAVVIARLGPAEDPAPLARLAARLAPAAVIGGGRHEVRGVRTLDGRPAPAVRVRVLTATGNPHAVVASAEEAGLEVVASAFRRDHHWFSVHEARAEVARAARDRAVLLLTAKDAVRWPLPPDEAVRVLEVAWRWVWNGDTVEHAVLGGSGARRS
jgi:tetraacyldisaccharide 4'-kinase